jgi:hypothetical protein
LYRPILNPKFLKPLVLLLQSLLEQFPNLLFPFVEVRFLGSDRLQLADQGIDFLSPLSPLRLGRGLLSVGWLCCLPLHSADERLEPGGYFRAFCRVELENPRALRQLHNPGLQFGIV